MHSGATSAPIDAPELNTAVANARSFLGKYCAVTLMAAGKLPDSPTASRARHPRKRYTLTVEMERARAEPDSTALRASIEPMPSIFIVAQPQPACITAASDHTKMAQR